MTDTDLMPFGLHKGKALANVPAAYLLWLYEKGCDHTGLMRYINDNLDALKNEVRKLPRR